MKIGTTILALPDHSLTRSLGYDFDIIETTRQMLFSSHFPYKKVTSMLSAIDMRYIQDINLVDNTDICKTLIVEAILLANANGLNSLSFGCPALRKKFMSQVDFVNFMIDVSKSVNERLEKPFTFYIEPLLSDVGFLDSYVDLVTTCNQYSRFAKLSKLKVKPMLDTGWYLKSRKPETSQAMFADMVARTTDRIHFSLADVTSQFDLDDHDCNRVIDLVNEILSINIDMTIIYEHINKDQNMSFDEFFEFYDKIRSA